jgi:hypothetical protein
METISSNTWQYKGSSVIFNHTMLKGFIGSQVSLRQVLLWANNFPDNPPIKTGTKTILVTGLETLVETLPLNEAEDFLGSRVQPLLRRIQQRWTDIGIVFGFVNPPAAFELTVQDESLLFRRRDKSLVNLSNGLWDGSAPLNMRQVYAETLKTEPTHGQELIGYHVSRIS